MQRSMIKRLIQNSFWLSVLLHCLLLLCIFIVITFQPMKEKEKQRKSPHLFVPSYVYTGAIKPIAQQHRMQMQNAQPAESKESAQNSTSIQNKENMISKVSTENAILHMQKKQKKVTAEKSNRDQKSMLLASLNMLKQDQLKEISKPRESEPIYLIGDDNEPADPLIKLMGQSLSAHFRYPRMAGEFGIKGKVLIELTLHPEGYFSNVQMIRSSSNQDLDSAALYAVNSAPTVAGADRYISKPRHFVVGFVFY